MYLNEMYKVVSIGIEGLNMVTDKVDDKALQKTLIDALKKYKIYLKDIEESMEKRKEEVKDISGFTKMANKVITEVELMDSDDKKIIKMLILGTNKGIVKLEELLNKDLDSTEKSFAEKLLKLLEYQIKSWKVYL